MLGKRQIRVITRLQREFIYRNGPLTGLRLEQLQSGAAILTLSRFAFPDSEVESYRIGPRGGTGQRY